MGTKPPQKRRPWPSLSLRLEDNLPMLLLVGAVVISAIAPPVLWPSSHAESVTLYTFCCSNVLWAAFDVYRYLLGTAKIALASLIVWWALLYGSSALAAVVCVAYVFALLK